MGTASLPAHHIALRETSRHFLAHFKTARTDGGPEPGNDMVHAGSALNHAGKSVRHNAVDRTAPSGMSHPYHSRRHISHEHRDTIGGGHPYRHPFQASDKSIDTLQHRSRHRNAIDSKAID